MEDQVADFIRQAPNVEVASPSLTIADRMDYAKIRLWLPSKGSSVYRCRSHHRGSYPQSDPRAYRPKHSWKTDLVRRATGDSSRRSYVCGYFSEPSQSQKACSQKGQDLERFLSFMMAVTTLSLPSMVMLSKAIKKKLLGTFIGIVCIGIIIVGYGFNVII